MDEALAVGLPVLGEARGALWCMGGVVRSELKEGGAGHNVKDAGGCLRGPIFPWSSMQARLGRGVLGHFASCGSSCNVVVRVGKGHTRAPSDS